MAEARDWLLRFIAGSSDDREWIDRIRIMKGMFLFQKNGAPEEVRYAFRAYRYGPFTEEIYHDLTTLERDGYIESSIDERNYRATGIGYNHVRELAAPAARKLDTIRDEVSSLTFMGLLNRVYNEYPDYATNTVVPEALE